MKIDNITGKERIGRFAGDPDGTGPYILFADFLPAETEISLAASDLVIAAQAANTPITSATLASESYARVSLSCRTPMNYRRARQVIADMNLNRASHVVIVLDSFRRAEHQSTSRFRRIKERTRILFLLAEVLALRPSARVVVSGIADRCYLAAARALCMLKFGRMAQGLVHPMHDLLSGMLALETGLVTARRTTPDKARTMVQHAGPGGLEGRLTVQRLAAQAKRAEYSHDLGFLAAIAATPALKSHPTIRWLRMPTEPDSAEVQACPAPHRLLQTAQSLAPEARKFGLPITRYMMHLHSVLQLGQEFPLKTRRQAQAYVNWYQKRSFERVPAKWIPTLPVEATDFTTRPGVPDTRLNRARRIVLDMLEPATPLHLRDPEMQRYMAGNPTGAGPSRFAILLAALCQIHVRLKPDQSILALKDINIWFDTDACHRLPQCRQFSTSFRPRPKSADAIEVYGMPTSRTGLGTNTQMTVHMLDHLRLPYVVQDIDRRCQSPTLYASRDTTKSLGRQIVLHQMNADRIPLYMMSPQFAQRNDNYHIGFLLWELDRIPDAHRLGADMLDEIWAPSSFVRDLYSREVTTQVHLVKKGLLHLDKLRKISAGKTGLSGGFTALICFDFHSGVERKNPLAAVRAFQIAFPAKRHPECRLIVKTTPTTAGHWGDPHDQMGQIRRLAGRDRRIEVVEAFVPCDQLWQMMNAADCIISPHRAEGFGYIPAYALAMAKPLVVTDYGGPRDFCDIANSFPVAAAMTHVPAGHALYFPEGSRWADVAPEDLAKALRQVHDDPDMAAERGRIGQRRIAHDYSMTAFAGRCQDRLQQIGAL